MLSTDKHEIEHSATTYKY